ncbi:polysaccharide deacetylase family protein [Agromyces sp. H66]|uniref:polysaccharide deacetylase family protein n=1 Tax=Agromyces sp. H66 TaxID=2529859 RepID=UPI0010A9F566|nr:polysaccharide deacetylase family protein [Agromyces sp. H66]
MTRSRWGRRPAARGRVGLALTCAAVVAALVGCSVARPAVDASQPGDDASAAASTPPASSTEVPPQPRVDVGYPMPRLGPEEAPGLVARLAAMAAPEFTVVARWATPPGASVLGDALDTRFAEMVRGYAEEHGHEWSPGVDIAPGGVGAPCARHPLTEPVGASLTVDCAIVTATGTLLGERLVVIRRDGATATAVDRATWYADAATGEFGDGAALYRPGAEARVLALLAEGLRSAGLAGSADPFAGFTPEGVRRILADTVVTADDIVVQVPLIATPDGRGRGIVAVLVPARLVAPFLSPFGVAVQAAVSGAAPYAPATAPTGADRVDCTLVACVSITFDDGPSRHTEALIDALRDLRAPATFFLQGVNVEDHPDVVGRLVAEEHGLGNHTWGHPYLTKLPDPEVRAEIERTQEGIEAAAEVQATSLRPPYGDVDQRVRDLAGLPIVLWDVDTDDWQEPGSDVVAERAISWSSRGSIVLMHDTHEETVAAVPGIIDGLRDRGFTLATVSDQFGGVLPGSGTLVSHGPR